MASGLLDESLDSVIARINFDEAGLVPAIVQQWDTGRVLMMAWMDEDAFRATFESRRGTYYSRSRGRQWVKGESSGNTQEVRELHLDCDGRHRARRCRPARSCLPHGFLELLRGRGRSAVDGETSLDLAGFRDAARTDRVIPVSRTLLADGLTAVGLFEVLCGSRAGTFLLESAEAGRSWSRYSFIGVRAAAMLAEVDGQPRWFGRVPVGLPTTGSTWEVLAESARVLHTPQDASRGGPHLTSGFVGLPVL